MSDRRTLGISALLVAAGPIAFIVIFGSWGAAGLSQRDAADPTIAIPFLRLHQAMVLAPTLNSLVMHVAAITLAIGLLAALRERAPLLATVGAVFGVMWGVLDIAQSVVTFNAVVGRPTADPATVDIVTKGLQNAAHFGGGLWTLSIAAASAGLFSGIHRAVGFVAGAVFALHSLVVPAVPEFFYLEFALLPIWFAWTGLAILRGRETAAAMRPAIA